MSTVVIASGTDAFVTSQVPKANFGDWAYPFTQNHPGSIASILLHMPGIPVGVVVLSATLSVPTRTINISGASTSVNVSAIATSWSDAQVTYATIPAGVGVTVTTSIPNTVADGDTISLDVTALVQAIAAGQANYGWFVRNTGITDSLSVYGFDSGHESWTLTIEVSDVPVAPTQMTPEGVVSLNKWVCQLGDADDIAQIRVQVDPAANSASPAFDSGWVATTTPTLDLATTTYTGLADGASTWWRAAFKTSTGATSDFGDWVQDTRHVKPAIVMDSPPAGLVYDSTPTIEAHLSPAGSSTTRWQVRLLSATDASKVLYDSGGDITGATLSHTIPHRYRNKVVVATDGAYRLQVYCWDRSDRVGSYGDPPHLLVDETMTVDVDGTVTAPSGLVVSQPAPGVPDVLLHFTAAADPDYFTVERRDGTAWAKIPFQIAPDDARISPGVFEWVDASASPNMPHSYRVRAHVGGRQSANSVSATLTPYVEGVWIRSNFGTVTFNEDDIDNIKQTDKRISYALPYAFEDVDVIGAVAGYSVDNAKFSIDSRDLGGWTQDVDAACVVLEEIRQHPHQPVQLIWGTRSIPVYLRGLSVAPASSMIPDRDREHSVSFGFFQTDDVQQAGFGVGYYGAGTYY